MEIIEDQYVSSRGKEHSFDLHHTYLSYRHVQYMSSFTCARLMKNVQPKKTRKIYMVIFVGNCLEKVQEKCHEVVYKLLDKHLVFIHTRKIHQTFIDFNRTNCQKICDN